MKTNKQLKVALEMLIILIILMISFIGIYQKQNGKMVNILKDYTYGRSLSGERQIVLTQVKSEQPVAEEPAVEQDEDTKEVSTETTQVSNEDLEKTLEIYKSRIEKSGITDFSMSFDKETANILLNASDSDLLDEAIGSIFERGEFLLKDSETEEVLLNNSNIKDAKVGYNNTNEGTSIYLSINFDKVGTEKLKEISSVYVQTKDEEGNETSKTVSLSMDGEVVTTTYFGETIQNGTLQLSIGSATTDNEKMQGYLKNASLISLILSTGLVPVEYELSGNEYIVSTVSGENMATLAIIAIVLVVAMMTYLIIEYRSRGIVASVIFVGYLALLLLAIRLSNSVFSFESITAIGLSCVFYYIFVIRLLNALKKYKENDTTPKAEINKEIIRTLFTLIPVLIVAIVFTFATSVAVSSFGIALFWGILIFLIYTFAIAKVVLLNFEYICEE